MKLHVKGIVMLTLLSSFALSNAYADSVVKLSVDEAIDTAIELNTSIDTLERRIPDMDDAIRKSNFSEDTADLTLHDYKVFRDIYVSDEDKYDEYLSMSSSELSELNSKLFTKISRTTNPSAMQSSSYLMTLEEIEFISGIFKFGNSKPELTDSKLYSDFKKDSTFTVRNAEFSKEQLIDNIENTKNMISVQISNIYKSVLDTKFMMDMSRDLIISSKSKLDIVEENYKLGLVSELEYNYEKVNYEKSLLEYQNTVLVYRNLDMMLKNELKIDPSDTIILIDDFSSRYSSEYNSIKEYKEAATKSNITLKNLEIELDILKDKLTLYTKYNDDTSTSKEYKDLALEISQKEDKIVNEKYKLEINIYDALADINTKEINIKKAQSAYDISNIVYEDALNKNELGLMSDINVVDLKLDKENKNISLASAKREYDNSKYLFDLLINYGVKY